MKDINEFYLFYEEKLKSIIEENAKRVKAFKKVDWAMAGLAFGIGAFLLLVDSLWIAVILGATAVLLVCLKKHVDYYPEYRRRLLSGIIDFIDSDLDYHGRSSLRVTDFKNSGISFPFEGKYEISDVVMGKAHGVIVRLACVKIKSVVRLYFSKEMPRYGNSLGLFMVLFLVFLGFAPIMGSYFGLDTDFSGAITAVLFFIELGIAFFLAIGLTLETMPDNEEYGMGDYGFKGIFMVMDFNKDFKCITVGVSRALGIAGGKPEIPGGGEKVELENQDFMEHFSIYSGSQQEARYLLTPAMIEALYGLQMRVGKPMSFSFKDSKLFIIFSGADFLSASIFRDGGDKFVQVGEAYVFISEILDTASALGLDTRIWTKM